MFITEAFAQAADGAAAQGSPFTLPLMMAGMFAVFYFLVLRPNAKRQKEHQAMLSALAKGDEVVTAGGIFGRVAKIGENAVTLELAEGVEVQIQRAAITQVLPKGTIKN